MKPLHENPKLGLPSDRDVELHAHTVFRAACEATGTAHAARLGSARRQALEAGTARAGFGRWLAPLAGSAVACCALLVGSIVLRPAAPLPTAATAVMQVATTPSRAAVNADNDDADANTPEVASNQMDMVQNLDFYQWLAAQPTVASASAPGGQ